MRRAPARTGPRETQRSPRAERSFSEVRVGFTRKTVSEEPPRYNPPRSRQFRYKKCSRAFAPKTIFEFDWNYCQLSPHVAAYLAGRVRRPLPPNKTRSAAFRTDRLKRAAVPLETS